MNTDAATARRVLAIAMVCSALTSAAFADVMLDYQADTLPLSPWEFISGGPLVETSQHTVFVDSGVLHMIDSAQLVGNTLGYLQYVPLEPEMVIDVEFRARVLSGGTALGDGRAPFSVWLFNGTARADLSVGPDSVSALGEGGSLLLDEPLDGANWHDYRYRLDPQGLEWWVDDVSLGSVSYDLLIDNIGDDPRVNLFITSASANVELDSFMLTGSVEGRPVPAISAWGLVALTGAMSLGFAWRIVARTAAAAQSK